MRKFISFVVLYLSAMACHAQGGYIHGDGDPRTQTPVPNCGNSRFYIDDSTGTMYTATQGSPCVWTLGGGGSGSVAAGTGVTYYTTPGGTSVGGANLSGIIKGNGSSAPTAAVAGTDYQLPAPTNIVTGTGNVPVVDSIATNANFGITAFGDSIPFGTGASVNYPSLISTDTGALPLSNNAVGGDTAGDMAFHIFSVLNPSDTSNPIVTSSIGRNEQLNFGTGAVPVFTRYQYANASWSGMSSTNKILTGNAAVTKTGTWTADTTFAQANGQTSSTASSILTYSASLGPCGCFYVWYKMSATAGTFTVDNGGSALTDTVTGGSTINVVWTGDTGAHQTSAVGMARFVVTGGANSSQTLNVNYQSGTVTILGFGFPPVTRYRGSASPRYFMGNLIPQGGNVSAAQDALYNAADAAVATQLTSDGLFVYLVDLSNALDTNLDFVGVATQNCTAGTNVPIHPNNCGQRHIAQRFEAAINAAPVVYSYQKTFLNTNATNTFATNTVGDGLKCFGASSDAFLCQFGFEYDNDNSLYASTVWYGANTEVAFKTAATGYAAPANATTRARLDASGDFFSTGYNSAKGLVQATSVKTGAYTVTSIDYTVRCDATSAGVTITLPASPITGQIVVMKKIDSSANACTLSGNGKNIDGSATQATTTQYAIFRVQYNGTTWDVL